MQTQCNKCMFAVETDGQQTDCIANRLTKFYKLGKANVQPEDTHFTINGICNMCYSSDDKDIDVYDALKVVKRRVVPRVECFIKVSDSTKLCELEETVHSLTRQIVRPYITLIVKQDYPLYKLHDYVLRDPYIKMSQIYHEDYNLEIRTLAKSSTCQYLSIIDAGKTYNSLLFAKLHGRTNIQLRPVVLVRSPFIIVTKLYNFLCTDKSLTRNEVVKLVEEKAAVSSEASMIWEKL